MLTNPRTCHAATRRFFEGRLWTVVSVLYIAGLLALGYVLAAVFHAVTYFIIYFMFAHLRRTERAILRELEQRETLRTVR